VDEGPVAPVDARPSVWDAGDYDFVARGLEASSRDFLARHAPRRGLRVLDVACGTGQVAIPAAQAGADVSGLDIAASLVDTARARARQLGLDVRFDVGDAASLPYPDKTFDLVISLLGVMFARRPARVAAELLRVCRPGGRIVLGNWVPDGFVAAHLAVVGSYAADWSSPSPFLWGRERMIRARFARSVSLLQMARVRLTFLYPLDPAAVVPHLMTHCGPTRAASARLTEADRRAMRADLTALWSRANLGAEGATKVHDEILEVVAVRA
jgi:SAM-dependent methyltransferase